MEGWIHRNTGSIMDDIIKRCKDVKAIGDIIEPYENKIRIIKDIYGSRSKYIETVRTEIATKISEYLLDNLVKI